MLTLKSNSELYKMNILFLVSNDGGNGVGGHYNSVNQVSLEMAKEHNVKVVTLGSRTSPVVQDNPYFDCHVMVGKGPGTLIKLNRELKKITKEFKPDVVNCFDSDSMNRILLLPVMFGAPIVFTKCGGKNPSGKKYQHADAIVVFSNENRDWFINNEEYKSNDIFLIPNRVQKLQFLEESKRVELKDPGKITFVRISRLGGAYEKTLLDTFNLIEELNRNYPVELVVIGRIQDETRFGALVKNASDRNLPVRYITDERAAKGSGFLYLADFVVGTGRSFMEATSLGIPALTPASNSDFPVLVNNANFNSFFDTNFSERNVASDEAIKNNLSTIQQLIENKDKYEGSRKEMLTLFREYFGVEGILLKYNAVYNYVVSKRAGRLGLIRRNFLYLVKFFMGK